MVRYPDYGFPRQTDLPTARSEVKGKLSLQLPDKLATKIASAVAGQFTPEPTQETLDRFSGSGSH